MEFNDAVIIKINKEIYILEKKLKPRMLKRKRKIYERFINIKMMQKEIYILKKRLRLYKFEEEINREQISNVKIELEQKIDCYVKITGCALY